MGLSTKMLNILSRLYMDTESAVWNGELFSEWFATTMGVKQGCIFSTLLFILFLNDLNDVLCGGVLWCGRRIRVLMYADDTVMISDSLQ